jgi:hypothetical protein
MDNCWTITIITESLGYYCRSRISKFLEVLWVSIGAYILPKYVIRTYAKVKKMTKTCLARNFESNKGDPLHER